MGQKVTYTCDVCGKLIETEHQLLYMVTMKVHSVETVDDGGVGTIKLTHTYHIHNDFSNHCMGKIWALLMTLKGG